MAGMVSSYAQSLHMTARQATLENKELETAITDIEIRMGDSWIWTDQDIADFADEIVQIPRIIYKNPYALALAWYVERHRFANEKIDSISLTLGDKRTVTGLDVRKYMLLFQKHI